MVFMFFLNYYPLTTNALSHFIVNLLYWELSPTCSPWYQIFLLCLHLLQLVFLIFCLRPLSSTYVLSMGSQRLWARPSSLFSFIFSSYGVIYYWHHDESHIFIFNFSGGLSPKLSVCIVLFSPKAFSFLLPVISTLMKGIFVHPIAVIETWISDFFLSYFTDLITHYNLRILCV